MRIEIGQSGKIENFGQLSQDYMPISLSNSDVLYTLTFDCFLNAFSSDQIGQPKCKESAKYSISFGWGEIFLASEILSIKSSKGMNLTLNFMIPIKLSKSSCENPDLSLISSLLF